MPQKLDENVMLTRYIRGTGSWVPHCGRIPGRDRQSILVGYMEQEVDFLPPPFPFPQEIKLVSLVNCICLSTSLLGGLPRVKDAYP
jgi:hypothetical protein